MKIFKAVFLIIIGCLNVFLLGGYSVCAFNNIKEIEMSKWILSSIFAILCISIGVYEFVKIYKKEEK